MSINKLLKDKWLDIADLPNTHMSFQMLIQFEEWYHAPDNPHICTASYWHLHDMIEIDNKEMKSFHPKKFYPLYHSVKVSKK